ncbi:glycoside hydrolase family 16 protein [Flavobacterium sp. RSSA_27]|uniref:glycoside hydrolase family 16 protein n=1 Tax=Flavobacterium sp. RSSA_27 TaxID=3447667 RepID=UPI003F2A4994
MKKIFFNIIALFSLLVMVNCQDDNVEFGSLEAPSNLVVSFDIVGKTPQTPNGDGSGIVKFTAKADNAITYKFVYGDGTSELSPSGMTEHGFAVVGVNTYNVTVIANGKGGVTSSTIFEVKVFSNFSDPESTNFLTGGTAAGKKWYIAANEVAHLGVGPNSSNNEENYFPKWYQAAAFEKAATCFYDGEYTFALVNGKIEFKQDNKGNTFFQNSYKSLGGGTNGGDDQCLPFNTAGTKLVSLAPSTSVVSKNPNVASKVTGTVMNFSDGGFMGYYAGATQYEILTITENRMTVRFVQANNAELAWYQTFTTTKPSQAAPDDFTKLVWEDTFDTAGAPSTTNWSYDLGTGSGGWGNGELQSYTNEAKNIKVEGGMLKITAIKEGSGYSSARIKTEDKFKFKYGKVEFRAKMPAGVGTWGAVWSLGQDFKTVGWPNCGEIDFLEYVGKNPNEIIGAFHFPGNSGGGAIVGKTTISNPTTEFHVYKTIWTATSIKMYVDDKLYHSLDNTPASVYNKEFFLILNVAMGGTLGGPVDPAFTQSTMEVDYIKVYQ